MKKRDKMDEKAKIIFNEVYKKQQGTEAITLSECYFKNIHGQLLYTDYYDLNNGLYVEMSQGEDENYRDAYCVFVVQENNGKFSKCKNLQKSFRTIEHAKTYMKELSAKY